MTNTTVIYRKSRPALADSFSLAFKEPPTCFLVELIGFEPTTSDLQSPRSPN